MKQKIKQLIIEIYKRLTYIIPTSKKIILFQSSNGRNYSGNPRYIYEEMVRQGLDKESGYCLIPQSRSRAAAKK